MQYVVPQNWTPERADAAIEEFRETALRSRLWQTTFGDRLLRWFWKSWLGAWVRQKFADATPEEVHGYAFWGPIALAILITELLGAHAFGPFERWPTISSTIGHLEDRDSRWGLPVVFLIAIAAFSAVSYATQSSRRERTEFIFVVPRFQFRYGWPFVLGATAISGVVMYAFSDDKYHVGYAIYGAFTVFGIAVPLMLAWKWRRHVRFPTLFYAFSRLRIRFRWIASVVIGLLAILVIHLALYPWPNLQREPAKYAGLNGPQARARAERALRDEPHAKPNLAVSAQSRGITQGRYAWYVYFSDLSRGAIPDCFVIVQKARTTPSPECLK